MRPITYTAKLTFAVALLPACAASVWLVRVPDAMSSSTGAALAALLIALGGVTLMTYRHAQAASSTAQLLHATEAVRRPVVPGVAASPHAQRSESCSCTPLR